MATNKRFHQSTLHFGADPEFFVTSADGKVINAETIVPSKDQKGTNKVFADGIAMEINPVADTCRERFCSSIINCLKIVREKLNASGGKLKIMIGSTVPIDLGILEGATDHAKKFMCAPSNSAYTTETDKVTLDASTHDKRYGGGHIHLGASGSSLDGVFAHQHADIIKAMDILVGNMSVLLDRDPLSAERRKLYGKPGEYRRPSTYRLEYRVLSNFWMKSPVLMYFVMGSARAACNIVANKKQNELFNLVDFDKIKEAITTNNFALAWANAQPVLEWVPQYFYEYESYVYPLRNRTNQTIFKWMITHGDAILPDVQHDMITRWNGTHRGWEQYCGKVRGLLQDSEMKEKDLHFASWSPKMLEAKIKEESYGSRGSLS